METICIYRGNNHQETLQVKEILESNGILTIMPNEHISGIVPYYSDMTGGFSLLINVSEFLEAAELLNSLSYKIENSNLIENLEKIQISKELSICPLCGNKSVETIITKRKGLILFLFLLFHIPVDVKKVKKVCHLCNHQF